MLEKLQELIDVFGLNRQVILKGNENDKKQIYQEKAFLVMTSGFEGFGMVLVEAMQFRLPLISFASKYGPQEIIKNGENGFLVPVGDIDELACQIKVLIENSSLRKELSNNSLMSLERFAPDKVVSQWIQLFERVTSVHAD